MTSNYSRRSFVRSTGLFGCALPLSALAQRIPSPSARRIGFLSGAVPTLIKSFDEEMRRRGYVEGDNIVIEKRISRPNSSDLISHAAELARMDLDLIVAAALPQALEVRKNNPNMPMVIATSLAWSATGLLRVSSGPAVFTPG